MKKQVSSVIIILLFLIYGCKKDSHINQAQIDPAVQFTSTKFLDWYLWYDAIPQVTLSSYKTPAEYIDAVRYTKDRWSFTMALDELNALLLNGETTGWGAGFGFDRYNVLRILFVYDKSAMGQAGVKRGWQVKSMNGIAVSAMSDAEINQALGLSTISILFIKNDGTEVTIPLSRGAVTINSVLYSDIIQKGSKKIGYFVFSDFLESSVKELYTVFDSYSGTGLKDLIIDLRYNGGGTLDCADSLIALIAGNPFKDKVYNTLTYNNKHIREGFQSPIGIKPNSILLDNLIFITTSGTASASELVISGLKPYMKIKLIGSKTHGKPVGMNIFSDTRLNLAVAPICFKNVNSDGYSDYYDGLPVDFAILDDYSKDWGDLSDPCLNAALNYISTGAIGMVETKAAIQEGRLLYRGSDNPLKDLYQMKVKY
jgi:carboxyl-terminal processing protease